MAKAKRRKTTRRVVDRETLAAEIVVDTIEDALGTDVPGMGSLKKVLPAVIRLAGEKGPDAAVHHLAGLGTSDTTHFDTVYSYSNDDDWSDVKAGIRTLAKRKAIWRLVATLTKAVSCVLESC